MGLKESFLRETMGREPVSGGFEIPVVAYSCDAVAAPSALGGAMAKPLDERQKDLLWPALEGIIDFGRTMLRLAHGSIGSFWTGDLPVSARPGQRAHSWAQRGVRLVYENELD
jgi:hypothetical protein